ncbi:unnamed protein product [Cuscuta campestris]|uniref:Uncharacterized protein n=1 Tax=Cuscuta campestris TaxID=132261 RepID=A0A484L3C4_9ASTE|nr:unnamed protein product [Cuscuta campestris]
MGPNWTLIRIGHGRPFVRRKNQKLWRPAQTPEGGTLGFSDTSDLFPSFCAIIVLVRKRDYYEPHGDQYDYNQHGPTYNYQPNPYEEELRKAENRREELDEELMNEDPSYQPPPLHNYNNHSVAFKLEWNKRAIEWRFNRIAQLQEERAQRERDAKEFYDKENEVRELDRLLAMHNIFFMSPTYDRYDELSPEFWRKHMEQHICIRSDKLNLLEEQAEYDLRAQEELEQSREWEPHQVDQEEIYLDPILEDSKEPAPAQEPEYSMTQHVLTQAIVMELPECPHSGKMDAAWMIPHGDQHTLRDLDALPLTSNEARKKFLIWGNQKSLQPPLVLDPATLIESGHWEEIDEFLYDPKWRVLLFLRAAASLEQTVEFLCSLQFFNKEEEVKAPAEVTCATTVIFTLVGRRFQLSVADLVWLLSLYTLDEMRTEEFARLPDTLDPAFNAKKFWQANGRGIYVSGSTISMYWKRPTWRILHHALVHSYFGRAHALDIVYESDLLEHGFTPYVVLNCVWFL